MNTSLMTVSCSEDNIGTVAANLNTLDFEHTIVSLVCERHTIRTPDLVHQMAFTVLKQSYLIVD